MTVYSSDVIKRVLRHAGRRDHQVAEDEGLAVDVVRGVRLGAARNALDGTRRQAPKRTAAPERGRRRRDERVDFEAMMTTNASVCT